MTAQQREGYGKYFAARALVFCSLFYLYIRLWVDPLLLYHVQEPPFFFGWNFFADLAAYPGGLSEYLSSFLTQFYFFPWFGALCITAIVGLICLCTRTHITALGGARFTNLPFMPAIFLVVLHNRYLYELAADLGLLFVLVAVAVYACMPLCRASLRALEMMKGRFTSVEAQEESSCLARSAAFFLDSPSAGGMGSASTASLVRTRGRVGVRWGTPTG